MAKYEKAIECPHCGHKGVDFKVVKEWAHGLHLVNRVKCASCDFDFRIYWGEKMSGENFVYTIPKKLEEV